MNTFCWENVVKNEFVAYHWGFRMNSQRIMKHRAVDFPLPPNHFATLIVLEWFAGEHAENSHVNAFCPNASVFPVPSSLWTLERSAAALRPLPWCPARWPTSQTIFRDSTSRATFESAHYMLKVVASRKSLFNWLKSISNLLNDHMNYSFWRHFVA